MKILWPLLLVLPIVGSADVILLPTPLQAVAGAAGTRWETHVTLFNGNPVPVTVQLEVCNLSIGGCTVIIPPGTARALAPYADPHFGPQLLRIEPSGKAAQVHVDVRVHEQSGSLCASSPTELPVPRDNELSSTIHLFPLPLKADRRPALRILAEPDHRSSDAKVLVRVFDLHTGRHLLEEHHTLPGAGPISPAYAGQDVPDAFIADLFGRVELNGIADLRVEVQAMSAHRIWAFVTITDNTTQDISTVTPR